MHAQSAARPAARRFARHYAEMVVAMFLGMAVLGVPAGWALGRGRHELVRRSRRRPRADAPRAWRLTMTVPMVGWMATAATAGARPT